MFKALFYKEWIKSRRLILLSLIIFICVIIYTFINISQAFRINGSIQVWNSIILNDMPVLPSVLQWLPLLFALSLSFVQYIPEIINKRLKLTLHLPMSETNIISTMLLYGFSVLIITYVFIYAMLMVGLAFYYPVEIQLMTLEKSLPWFMSGLAAYLLIAWICLEPVWKQRIYNTIIALCVLSLYFIKAISGSYLPLMPFLLAIIVVCYGLPFYSTVRFKEGQQ